MHIIQAPETSFNLTKYQNCLRITTPFIQYTFLPRPFIPISSVNPLKALGIDHEMLRNPIYNLYLLTYSPITLLILPLQASHTLYHVYSFSSPLRLVLVYKPL